MTGDLDIVRTVIAWALIGAGGFFVIVSAIGLNRMPDVFTRQHAGSVGDTFGAGLMLDRHDGRCRLLAGDGEADHPAALPLVHGAGRRPRDRARRPAGGREADPRRADGETASDQEDAS